MKKRMMMAAVLSLALMAAGCAKGNTKTTESTTETTKETETSSETTAAQAERPDYKALDYVTLGQYTGLEVTLASTKATEEEINARGSHCQGGL